MAKTGKNEPNARSDGRKPLLVYMLPDLVKELKKAGLDEDRNAYEIVEEAVKDWLARRRPRKAKGAG
jgi:hypothetical protein